MAPWRPRGVWLSALLLLAGPLRQGPPDLDGIRVGSSAGEVRAALGRPERTQASIGMRFWDYARRGITVVWRDGEPGVLGIVASTPAAGAIGGVRVGDSEARLFRQWGSPARARQEGRFLDFVGAQWVLSVEMRGGHVVQMTLMGTSEMPP